MIAPWQNRYLHFIGKRNEGLKSGSFGQVYIVSKWESRNKVPKHPVFAISSLANFFSVDLYPETPEIHPLETTVIYVKFLWWPAHHDDPTGYQASPCSLDISCLPHCVSRSLQVYSHMRVLPIFLWAWSSLLPSSSSPGTWVPTLRGTHTTQPFIPLDSAQMSPPTTIIQAAHILGVISCPISLLIFFIKVRISKIHFIFNLFALICTSGRYFLQTTDKSPSC